MVAIRINNSLSLLRAVARPRAAPLNRHFVTSRRVLAQGYGDGEGDPQGEDPQSAPGASKAHESAEHPGPPPPDVGKGTGGGPTKANNSTKSPEDASAGSGGARSKEAKETGSSPTGGEIASSPSEAGEGLKGPQKDGAPKPKVYNQAMPAAKQGLSEEQKAEVERHNEDFEKKHDRSASAEDDKVDKKFWKGQGGKQGNSRTGTETDWSA